MAQKRSCSEDGPPAKRHQCLFTLRSSACWNFLKTFACDGFGRDAVLFLDSCNSDLHRLLAAELDEHQFKVFLVFHVELEKEKGESAHALVLSRTLFRHFFPAHHTQSS